MNYCATHNQFYSSHCVYCGPPFVRATGNGDAPQRPLATGGVCGTCGQPLLQGVSHNCPRYAPGVVVTTTHCGQCGQPIYAGLQHVCMYVFLPGVLVTGGNSTSANIGSAEL